MNIVLKPLEIVLFIIVFNLLLFSVFLISFKKPSDNRHFFLGIFFLALAINIFHVITLRLPEYFTRMVHLYYLGSPFAYVYAPGLYLYILRLIRNYRFRYYDLLHFLPFLCFTIYLCFTFYFEPAEIKIDRIYRHSVLNHSLWISLVVLLHIQIVTYIILGILAVRRYRRRIKNYYASVEKINYSWIKFIFLSVILLWLVDLLRFISNLSNMASFHSIEVILFSGFLLLCYVIIYKAVRQPAIFNISYLQQERKPSLSESVREKYGKILLDYMDSEKPYLDPDITLPELAKKVAIPVRSLSEIINNDLNKNFYDFINSYRIRESERLLKESTRFKTVLEVLYEVGFNSKTAFHNAFKKNTGMTPTQYKKLP